ncbi:hypothetical protein WA026_007686 [Henosepilachna vigintioctopunctata]|uniref:Uncharacterized protein n=1 Tax=Henosepilachna vigintioctopunctata TaxID=420089 RepID=A0AAW1U3S4_9CUCU
MYLAITNEYQCVVCYLNFLFIEVEYGGGEMSFTALEIKELVRKEGDEKGGEKEERSLIFKNDGFYAKICNSLHHWFLRSVRFKDLQELCDKI